MKIFITNFWLITFFYTSYNLLAQESQHHGSIHYVISKDIKYTEISLLGLNLMYDFRLNKNFGLSSSLNVNDLYFYRPDKPGTIERIKSVIFFSFDETFKYNFSNWNNTTPYIGLGLGFYLFDNYYNNHIIIGGTTSEERFESSLGYNIVIGLFNYNGGLSCFIKYLYLPVNFFQNKWVDNLGGEGYYKSFNKTLTLHIFYLGVGYSF